MAAADLSAAKALFAGERAQKEGSASSAFKDLSQEEKQFWLKEAEELRLQHQELHYGEMLKLAVLYLNVLVELDKSNNEEATELCYNDGGSDPTKWDNLMKDGEISFMTLNKKSLFFARVFFHGLWDRTLWIDEMFSDTLFSDGDEENYEELKGYVMNPVTYPGGGYALIEKLAEIAKDDVKKWHAPPERHPFKPYRSYTMFNLLEWAAYDLYVLRKKYPDLV